MAKEEQGLLTPSPKKDSPENKAIRSAQAVGKVWLTKTKVFEIIKDSEHLAKGEKVKLNKPTEEVFRAKGLIK